MSHHPKMRMNKTQELVQYMRSRPRDVFGMIPEKNIAAQTCRFFLDLVMRHYPEADVCLDLFEDQGKTGIRGWSHYEYSIFEIEPFAVFLQAFSSKGVLQYCWGSHSCKMEFFNGQETLHEDADNPEERTFLSFSFIPDEKLFGDDTMQEHDLFIIKCDYKHLFPELKIRRFNDGKKEDLTGGGYEGMFVLAARLIVECGTGKPSVIQKRFAMPYFKAKRLFEQMEDAGIIGPEKEQLTHDVLVTPEQLNDVIGRWKESHSTGQDDTDEDINSSF